MVLVVFVGVFQILRFLTNMIRPLQDYFCDGIGNSVAFTPQVSQNLPKYEFNFVQVLLSTNS
jgi:hypothetical protein